mmetsp:Transcript_35566/g.72094  ORF Transcript_35566/g.72094 Transcript_35566/m.72094 type:complete len:328 (+) Transcript_35566:82-1065(+)
MEPSSDPPPNAAAASAASAAASAVPVSDDATIAECLQCVEQLVNVFGFEYDLANDAVSAMGPDVTACYNWILDGGGEDKGGPVVPRLDCPHVVNHMLVSPSSLTIGRPCSHYAETDEHEQKATGGLKGATADDGSGSCPHGENWICLHCGVTRCSRYVNGHALAHYEQTKAVAVAKRERKMSLGKATASAGSSDNDDDDLAGHCIAVSLADLSVWCYECNAYLKHPRLEAITNRLEMLKFPDDSASAAADDDGGHSSDQSSVGSSDSNAGIPPGAAYLNGLGFAIPPEDMVTNRPKNLDEIAKFILSDECKSIAILAGAGMSKGKAR